MSHTHTHSHGQQHRVHMYETKISTCLVPLPFKKALLSVFTCLWNSNTFEVVFYVQQVVQTEQFVLVLFMPALEYCIMVFHASLLCIMQQLGEDLHQSHAVQLLLHVQVQQSSSDSAILCTQGSVLWNSRLQNVNNLRQWTELAWLAMQGWTTCRWRYVDKLPAELIMALKNQSGSLEALGLPASWETSKTTRGHMQHTLLNPTCTCYTLNTSSSLLLYVYSKFIWTHL